MQTKRITLLSPTMEGGGAERVMLTLGAAFVALGHAVDLVLISASGPYLKQIPPAIRVVDLKAARALRSIGPLAAYLRREQPDALFSTLGQANIAAVVARAIASPRTRLVVRETITLSAFAANVDSRKEKVLIRLLPHAYKKADAVVAPSRGVAADLARLMGTRGSRVVTIPNPVDAPAIRALAEQPVSHPWCRPDTDPLILAVGRLTAQKDFPNLITAFAYVLERQQARLIILGEGEEQAALQALIDRKGLREHAQLLGFASNPFSYMKRASVYVLSSRFEGLPNALLQALAVGTRVVATDCPSGPREILEDGRWGHLAPVANPRALADAIIATINAPPAAMPAELFDQRYGVMNCAQRYLAAAFDSQS